MPTAEQTGFDFHICSFYRSEAECLHLAERFLGPGLDARDRCLIFANERFGRELGQRLRHIAPAGRSRVDPDIVPPRVIGHSGVPAASKLGAIVKNAALATLGNGSSKVRVLVLIDRNGRFAHTFASECEQELAAIAQGLPVAICCLYHLEALSTGVLLTALRVHPLAMVGGRICRNPGYEPPEEVLLPQRERAVRQIERCLCHALETEGAEEELGRLHVAGGRTYNENAGYSRR
jgi:hypothetical protein